MSTTMQLLYTAPFSQDERTLLESLLFQGILYEAIADAELLGLSPGDVFQKRNFSFSQRQYAFIADVRTLAELQKKAAAPTVVVVSARSNTATDQWLAYDGPGDLRLLTPNVRLALLRSLAQERFALDKFTAAYFWETPDNKYDYNWRIWQIKTVRADPVGANYARIQYSLKDRDTLHAMFTTEAAKTDGVFRGFK